MFTIKQIRKIPKAMLERIKAKDDELIEKPDGNTRFYRYYTLYGKELAEVIVGVRNHYKKWYCKQVVVHGIHNKEVYLQDIGQTMGFRKVGWFRDGITKYPKWYDYNWGYNDDKYFYINAPIINKEFIMTLPQYKYSAINMYCYNDIFKYLRLYEQYPQMEYLVKMKLSYLATSKMILNKLSKDKKFQRFLTINLENIRNKQYKVGHLIKAFNSGKSLEEIHELETIKDWINKYSDKEEILSNFKDAKQLYDYLLLQHIGFSSYIDYYKACKELQLDMTLQKNLMPHDFKRWHDIRIDEYATLRAKRDAETRKELYMHFEQVAEKYLALQRNMKEKFVVIIAKSPSDLLIEGEKLHHCVGRMNYDQKFIREESLIFFVRDKQNVDTPFVTLEYSLKNKKVLQCYAEHDSKPADSVLDFVNNKWLPYANRKLNKIQKAVGNVTLHPLFL